MKYASLCFSTCNLGDEIQNLASEQFLPPVDKKFDRDQLNSVAEKERYVTILNGWYTHFPQNWPPSPSIIPVFIGFHITDWNDSWKYYLSKKSISYFKEHGPVGCRDQKTAERLADNGVDAFYSKCLTLTFPKRETAPHPGKIMLVDMIDYPHSLPDYAIPAQIQKEGVVLTHMVPDGSVPTIYDDTIKTLLAKRLLDSYKNEASLVVTSRLHCALPCLAFGIPVVFFGSSTDYRLSVLKDLGVTILDPAVYTKYSPRERDAFFDGIAWNPAPVMLETEKAKLLKTTQEMVREKVLKWS